MSIRSRVGSCALVATVSALALAASASAATFKSGDVVYHVKSDQVGSNSVNGLGISCGSSERLLSTGALLDANSNIGGFSGGLSSNGFFDADSDGVPDDQAIVNVFNSSQGTKKFEGTAICLKGSKRNDISYETSSATIGQSPPVTALSSTNCSSGSVGGIGALLGGQSASSSFITSIGLVLKGHKPKAGATSGRFRSSTSSLSFSLTSSCVPTTTVKRVSGLHGLYPGEVKTFKTACPKNTSAIGGGALGQAQPLLGSAPYDSGDKGKTPDDGWKIRVGSGDFAAFNAQAICRKN